MDMTAVIDVTSLNILEN